MDDDRWYAVNTTPADVESALRELQFARARRSPGFVPARVLNLVAIVDAEFSGEVENRLERLRAAHPSRLILCKVAEEQEGLDATASIGSTMGEPSGDRIAVGREKIELTLAPRHAAALDTIVGRLLIGDVPTVVWAPHRHADGLDSLRRHAQVVLLDSQDEPDPYDAMERARSLSEHMRVVDLAWLRSAPWRERVAATFDPPRLRGDLRSITAVTVRHREDSAAAGLLFCGWMASRLEWRPLSLTRTGVDRVGRLRARRGEVAVRLQSVDMQSPGLGGVTIETAAGESVSFDRGPGGLRSHRRERDGREQTWTVFGASRGEAGILADGVRIALSPGSIYEPALRAAHAMVA
ncbi:MAG: glucose-6-phosphate dehydrogenase assembly protein OpcA [Actinomycetota bacterium]|nr:glucose-6-phosphate dehydrogenase assembly protein OpcA [Actinomycetota bacterium]